MADQPSYMHGTPCWQELNTTDPGVALEFYTKLFGWTAEERDMGGFNYTVLQQHGQEFGGVFSMAGPEFQGVPPHWLTYFAVDDIDATLAKVQELGGSVHMPKKEIAVGFIAMVEDPRGAVFALFKGK